MPISGCIHSISISANKGEKKLPVQQAELIAGFGITGDAHAGSERQVSLLAFESFTKINAEYYDIKPGDFAENLTTTGVDFSAATVGRGLHIGENIQLEITHLGKVCHHGCRIREQLGDCIMPREGVFARVTRGGIARPGDCIRWI